MQAILHKCENGGEVYVRFSKTIQEEKELVNLAREVEFICKMGKKTGLWISGEFFFDDHKILLTSLEQKVEVSPTDLNEIVEIVRINLIKENESGIETENQDQL